MKMARLFMALLAMLVLIAPLNDAFARAGGSFSAGRSSPSYSSQGSRGSRTFAPDGGAPITRSMTPYQNNGPYSAPGNNGLGGGFRSGGFLPGLLGGFGGAWLFSHFFGGGGGYGNGGGGGGGFGFLIMLVILFFAGRWVWRMMSGGRVGGRGFGGFGGFGRPQMNATVPAYAGAATQNIALGDQDLAAFQQALAGIQTAWGDGDLARLRAFVTPEMLAYFSEELSRNQSLGLANRVQDVALQRGEPRESWSENGSDFATVFLQWLARDYTVRTDDRAGPAGSVADGDPDRPVMSQEIWTFQRARGGRWLLSAIQQSS